MFTVLLAMLPLMMMASPSGPDTTLGRAAVSASAAAGAGASLFWLFRWPSRRQALVYNVLCCAGIAAGCLALSNPYSGLMGCTLFAVIGGFLAYFHSVRHVAANFLVAVTCAAITAARLIADTGDVALTAAAAVNVIALNAGVPFGIHSLLHSLHTDLRAADRDPLTGLANRRSFYSAVNKLLADTHAVDAAINVMVIDLDKFKSLNDTRGHAIGDAALVDVADVLRRHTGVSAVIGRLGGEEFVIADVDLPVLQRRTAELIRQGIADSPFAITASIGVCSARMDWGSGIENDYIDRLIEAADAAMYVSKRAGGNRVVHSDLDGADFAEA
ncbi:diguanylate cyclase [Mycolicibacterium parafortuitum]|uniref:GGDEF domain-containing protein n=1 Tax=Mycolicibacterium parafortuitum TaxID=39692 RepID=UPI0032C411AC